MEMKSKERDDEGREKSSSEEKSVREGKVKMLERREKVLRTEKGRVRK